MALFKNRASSAAMVADVRVPRTKFKDPPTHKTTCNAGDIIPLRIFEILPGQTKHLNPAELIRSLTPIVPVMDNAFADIDCFFVPMRLVWEDWQAFNGENPDAPWYNDTEYTIPSIPAGTQLTPFGQLNPNIPGFGTEYTLWDYFGLPTYDANLASGDVTLYTPVAISILPFRGLGLIWNEFYRDQNTQTPLLVQTGSYSPSESPVNSRLADDLPRKYPLRSCRYHDYFSDCSPAPQKGPDVLIPGLSGIPVTTTSTNYTAGPNSGLVASMRFADTTTGNPISGTYDLGLNSSVLARYSGSPGTNPIGVTPINLATNLGVAGFTSGATIAALRTAFQIQKILERDVYGTRYTEILRNHFGVISPDARLQRPEYLGGTRIPLNVSQVIQTSSTDSTSPQGNTAAYSKTVDSKDMFTKSFTEHGYLYVLLTIRTENTYQQGIPRMFTRRTRYDFYMPELALISNQPVYRYEIFGYLTASDGPPPSTPSNTVFGYKEAWDEYRRPLSYVTGGFRSSATDSLDVWHYADYYGTPPILNAAWMTESTDNVNRTLAVPGTVRSHNQFLVDCYLEGDDILPMPATSQPGLVDHF